MVTKKELAEERMAIRHAFVSYAANYMKSSARYREAVNMAYVPEDGRFADSYDLIRFLNEREDEIIVYYSRQFGWGRLLRLRIWKELRLKRELKEQDELRARLRQWEVSRVALEQEGT